MYILIFVFLNLIVLVLSYSKRTHQFALLGILAILFIEPVFQKLTDSTLYGSTYLVFGFDRLKTNIIFSLSLLLMCMFPICKGYKPKFNIYIFLLLIFHVFNVLFSINQQNSLAIFLVSIILPLLFYKGLTSLGLKFFDDDNNILKSIYLSIILFFSIGLLMFNNSGLQASDIGINRVGGSIWLSNVSTQVLAVFFPLFLIKNNIKLINYIRTIGLVLYFVLLIISVSRTALVVYAIMAILFMLNSKNKIFFIFIGLVGLLSFYYILISYFNIDILEMYGSRFERTGTIASTIESDARANVFSEALSSFGKSNQFLGSGISTFNLLNSAGFSNAHNIFLNILVERGIIGLGLFLVFLYIIFKRKSYLLNSLKLSDLERKIITGFKIGIIGYLLVGLTGNDLFVNSGFINGWPLCCIIVSVVYVEFKIKKFNVSDN